MLGLVTRSKYGDCESMPGACTQAQKDSISAFALGADVSFVVALGAGITAATLFATSSDEPTLIVAPAGGGASAMLVGRF